MSLLAAIALAQAAGAAPPALAQADLPDARCIVVFGYVGAHGTPEAQEAAKRGILYYVGRLSGRRPGADLSRTIVRAAQGARAAKLDAKTELTRCGGELTRAMAAMNGVGAALRQALPAPTPNTP